MTKRKRPTGRACRDRRYNRVHGWTSESFPRLTHADTGSEPRQLGGRLARDGPDPIAA